MGKPSRETPSVTPGAAVEQALYKLGDHYDPASADEDAQAIVEEDAQAIVDALHAAGFRLIREQAQASSVGPGADQ